MIYTAEYLIERRKEHWNNSNDIDFDKRFRNATAQRLLEDRTLLEEIKVKPEKLIELLFIVVDKEQNTVPFFLNEVQKDFINKLNQAIEDYKKGLILDIGFIILKGRQQGFTTAITAYQLACIILNKNFQGFTIADETSNTEAIFQNKAKFVYDNLPETVKPTEKFNNKRQLLFEKLNSSWSVDTATKNMGRSRTINFFHGSECAFWQYGIAITQAGLGEAFTKNCIKIYESTANGFNDFKKMWDSGSYINCFYEWWKTEEYRTNFESEEVKAQFLYDIENKSEWIYSRLKWLKNVIKLEDEQLYWYYNKYDKYIDKDLIRQEYPCTPEEAFLATGECYFNKDKIVQRIAEVKNIKPIKKGFFTYKENILTASTGEKYITLTDISFKEDINGFIEIYEDVKERYPYVLSGDTAGEGSDFFTGQVINNITGKQVCKLRKKFDEIEYTKQMYCLGKYYNWALIGIENNFSTYPTNKLDEMKYPNLFIREKEDEYTNKKEKRFGFKTTAVTRPLVLANLQQIALEEIDKIVDLDTLNEMIVFVKNEKGRAEAEQGEHDDLVMALAIVYYIRTQQTFKLLPKELPKVVEIDYSPFGVDRYSNADEFESSIDII